MNDAATIGPERSASGTHAASSGFVAPRPRNEALRGQAAPPQEAQSRSTGRRLKEQSRTWLVEYPRAFPLCVFLAIATLTLLSVTLIERSQAAQREDALRDAAASIGASLERQADVATSYLRAGAALFATLDEVDEERFRLFAGKIQTVREARGAGGIGWSEAVRPGQLGAFEERIAQGAFGNFRVHPSPEPGRRLLTPVTYLLPDTVRNRRALGYDMYSEPIRAQAIDRALRTARPAATGLVDLVWDREPGAGFLIYVPVYEGGMQTGRLKGLIYSPFDGAAFLESGLRLEPGLSPAVALYDEQITPERRLARVGEPVPGARTITRDIVIAGRPMIVTVSGPGPASLSLISSLTLLFGLLVAGLLTIVVRLLTQQASEDHQAIEWYRQQSSIRDSLTRELNHRVKNTLANVLSIISLTRRRADTVEEFAEGLDGRVRALSATHDLLTQSEWGTVALREVIEAELAPYARAEEHDVEMTGPVVELAPNDALSIGLALHELATNAAKYGAFSQAGGRVRIDWVVMRNDVAQIEWREIGGPPIDPAARRRRGFGMELIEKIVAHELRSPVDLRFDPDGVRCTLMVPVRERGRFAIRAGAEPAA